MSLTVELRDKTSAARTFIDREFPHLRQMSREINKSMRCFDGLEYFKHPDLYTYSVIGTAVDYRVRSFFTDAPYLAWPVQNGLLTFKYVWTIDVDGRTIVNRFWGKPAEKLVPLFNRYSREFFKELRPTRRILSPRSEQMLCRYCALLARLDHFRRGQDYYFWETMESGRFDIEGCLRLTEPRWIEDISQTAAAYQKKHAALIRTFSKVHHGKPLTGSVDVGGADFDIVIDGCLIDIKTTVRPKISTENLRQLVGYWLLDYQDRLGIRAAAVHLTRQNHEQRFEISDLLRHGSPFSGLRKAFRTELRKPAAKR
jgi:hypothetical protein